MSPAVPFAYAPAPLDDEPLDGYLEHVAHRLAVPVADIYQYLDVRRTRAYAGARGLTSEQTELVSTALAIPPGRVTAMTLRRYAHLGLMPRGEPGRRKGGEFGARAAGARYCSECLKHRNLRWRLHWYLHWSFACAEHRVLLANRCQVCGGDIRRSRYGHPVAGPLTHHEFPSGDGLCRCATAALSQTKSAAFLATHAGLGPVLAAQRHIRAVIESPHAQVDYFGTPTPAITWIRDLASLTRRLIVHLPTDQIPPEYVDVLVETPHLAGDATPAPGAASSRVEVEDLLASWSPILGLTPMRSPAGRFSDAVRSPVAFAMAATAATLVLTSSSCEQARELVSVLLSPKARREAVTRANARSLSWNLIRALDDPTKARRPAAARSIRIVTARYRSDGTERWPLDGSRLPARAWPSLRAASPWADANPYIGLVVSAALLRIATNLTTTEACRQLSHEHLGPRTARELGPLLGRTPGSGHDHFEELVRLHDAISTAAVPIDYTRRRNTFRAPTPIPERAARRIARELGLRPTPRLRTFMSWWIYEALSGNDVLLSESCLHLPGPLRHAYARQRSEWESDPPPLMLRRAEHALLVNCLDEPITWAPVYGTDGCWTCPPPQLDRTLDGWANRSLRGARRSVSYDLDRLPLSGRVAFAMSDQSWETRRLAVLMARFKMVVDVGTITQTANLIGVRQPTLSVAMRSLERQVGVTLLERSRHGFTLTPQGRQLHQLITKSPLAHVDPAVRLNGPVTSTSTNGAPSPGGERERPRIPATP